MGLISRVSSRTYRKRPYWAMTTLRPFRVNDIFKFNRVNLDPLTETYGIGFYFHYLARWPEYFNVAEHGGSGNIMGYVMGKSEGKNDRWHGHVTAVTVAPMCRRIGLAKTLMDDLEGISDARDCKFVDLYVRRQNRQAISMYERLGYYVHEVVKDYYQGFDDPSVTEDAFDMHKILKNWTTKKNPRVSSAVQHIPDDYD